MAALTPRIRALRSAGRRGITLLELLVVMVILSIVTAASIPMLTTGVEQRRVREAARLVASYIGAAKSRAIETGSPAGVMIQRATSQNFALTLVGVEVPAPYCGDTITSTARVSSFAPGGAGTTNYGVITGMGSDTGWISIVRPGDLIRFGYQGRWYVLYGPNIPAATYTASNPFNTAPLTTAPSVPTMANPLNGWYFVAADGSGALPVTVPAAGGPNIIFTPYQFYRQPVKSAVQPLQLPEGTVIDLYVRQDAANPSPNPVYGGTSGIGTSTSVLTGTFVTNNPGLISPPFVGNPPYPNPIITFGPTGAVGFVYYDANPPQHLQSALYLLVGRREGMADVNSGGDPNNPPNIADTNNMWVAVSPQTGQVITAENAGLLGTNVPRQYVQAAMSIGGR